MLMSSNAIFGKTGTNSKSVWWLAGLEQWVKLQRALRITLFWQTVVFAVGIGWQTNKNGSSVSMLSAQDLHTLIGGIVSPSFAHNAGSKSFLTLKIRCRHLRRKKLPWAFLIAIQTLTGLCTPRWKHTNQIRFKHFLTMYSVLNVLAVNNVGIDQWPVVKQEICGRNSRLACTLRNYCNHIVV